MAGELALPVIVFLISAGSVVFFGIRLAVYGDALATSLPELSTNISAVRLDPPNPALAVGNVMGANMLNMFNISLVALMFGGKKFLDKVAPEQGVLAALAILLTGLAVLFGAIKMEISLWHIGLSSLLLIIVFLVGMRIVYVTKPAEQGSSDDEPETGDMTLKRAWIMFLGVSLGVVIAGFFLAWSTDRVADITGVASSTLGIIAVSLVTTMPEMSSAIAAARMGAADLGVAGLFGSNAFNVTILFFADPFYREGILGNQTEPAHFIAGGMAVVLMAVVLVVILARNRIKAPLVTAVLVLVVLAYIAGAVAVAGVGAGEDTAKGAASVRTYSPQQPR